MLVDGTRHRRQVDYASDRTEYDEMLALYSKRRIDNETNNKRVADLTIEIPALREALMNFNPVEVVPGEKSKEVAAV